MKNIARVDRHQRRHAAEQDGEQIERYASQDQRIATNKPDAGEQAWPASAAPFGVGCAASVIAPLTAAGDQPRHGDDRVGHAGRHRISEAAERRSDDGRDLNSGARDRGCPLQHPSRRHQRQHGRGGRTFESRRHPQNRHGGENLRHLEPAGKAAIGQKRRRRGGDDLRHLGDAAAVETVGGMTGDKHQQRHRHELRQSDQAKIERAVSQRVDLPADCDRADLVAESRKCAGGEEQQERWMAEQGCGRAGRARAKLATLHRRYNMRHVRLCNSALEYLNAQCGGEIGIVRQETPVFAGSKTMPRSFVTPMRRRTLLGGALAWSAATIAAPLPAARPRRNADQIRNGRAVDRRLREARRGRSRRRAARARRGQPGRRHSRPRGRASGRGFRQRRRHRRRQNQGADRSRPSRLHPRQRQLRGRAGHGAGHEREAQASHRHRRTHRRNHRIAMPLERVSHLQVGDHGSQRDRRHADREIRQEMVLPHAGLRLRLRAASGVRTKTSPAWRRMGRRSYSARHRRLFALLARRGCLIVRRC